MSKYKVSEPSALKFLKANGAVVDENGNVVNDASDYWKKVYDQAEPKVAKYLHADGTIDENPGSGGGADLEDNKTATIDVSTYTEPVEITPTAGKDGMKKATVTLSNIPSGGNPMNVSFKGWKGKDDNDKDVYIGFLKDGQWITDKSALDTYFNQDSEHFVFDTSVFDYCIFIPLDSSYYSQEFFSLENGSSISEYEFELYTGIPDFYVTTDTDYNGDLSISSRSDQITWRVKNWNTVEFVESLPLMTYTPSN